MAVLTLHVNFVLTSIFVFFFYKYVYTTVLSFDIVAVDEINFNSFIHSISAILNMSNLYGAVQVLHNGFFWKFDALTSDCIH